LAAPTILDGLLCPAARQPILARYVYRKVIYRLDRALTQTAIKWHARGAVPVQLGAPPTGWRR